MRLYFSKITSFLVVCIITSASCTNTSNSNTEEAQTSNSSAIAPPTELQYEIVKVHPHDTISYTQGLEWDNNRLIEGTGLNGLSFLHILDSNMKPISPKIKLQEKYFGEGTTLFKNKIYQLTWRENIVFVYDAISLKKIKELYWPYEGWGLTHDDSSLIVSTGSSNIYYVDPENFAIKRTLGVFNNYGYVSDINELEFVNGKIYANLYLHNNIIEIDPSSGRVKANIDMTSLLAQAGVKKDPRTINDGYVLNGIAYRESTNSFFITGKCWPVMVELKIK